MIGVKINPSALSIISKDKIKDIKIRENVQNIDEDTVNNANDAFIEVTNNLILKSRRLLQFGNKYRDFVLVSGSVSKNADEFVPVGYETASDNLVINIVSEDIPDEIADAVKDDLDSQSDMVMASVQNSKVLDPSDVLSNYYHEINTIGISVVEQKAERYDYDRVKLFSENIVKKACMIYENLSEDELIPSDTVTIEFGKNHDFGWISPSKYKYLGSFNSKYRQDRGHNYRTDQNAWKDIVFRFSSTNKSNTILDIPLPMNLDDEQLIMRYQAIKYLYDTDKEKSKKISITPIVSSEINYAINVNSYFMTVLFEQTNQDLEGVYLSDIKEYYEISRQRTSKFKGVKKDWDPVLDDSGFAYFESDNPFWRGSLYWPGAFVKNIAVYGSPYHLELPSTRTAFAMRRYINHKIISMFSEILKSSTDIHGLNKFLIKDKQVYDIYNVVSLDVYDLNSVKSKRISNQDVVGNILSMLFLSLAVLSMTKQCVKPNQVYYVSNYVKDRYLTPDFVQLIRKVNRISELLLGVGFEINEVDRSREIKYMFSQQTAVLLDKAIDKYWEVVEDNEKRISEGYAVFNA